MADTSVPVVVTVTNSDGLSSQLSTTIVVTDVRVALPPVINQVIIDPQSAPTGTLRTITVVAADPQGDSMQFTVLVDGTNVPPADTKMNFFTVTE